MPITSQHPRLSKRPTRGRLLHVGAFGMNAALAVGGASCSEKSVDGSTATSALGSTETSTALVDPRDPASCEACHAAVVSEWRDSQHARAHHDSDDVYAALRKLRIEKQGAHIPSQCGACHNPQDLEDPDSAAARQGVSCATCHQLEGVELGEGKKGVHALTRGLHGRFRGPHELLQGASPVHGNGPALPAIVDGKTLCLACHAEEKNAAGIVTCATGIEHAESPGAESCTSCHMPELDGPSGSVSKRTRHRSHQFLGPHLARRRGEPGVLAGAVGLGGTLEGDQLVATLENQSSHDFPTGFPGRTAMLVARALDAGGSELARNISTEPLKQHPEAVLNQGFAGEDGKPALAPFATKKVRDTRLRPNEKRALTWQVPAKTERVELSLRFFLVPPAMATSLRLAGPETLPLELPPVVIERKRGAKP